MWMPGGLYCTSLLSQTLTGYGTVLFLKMRGEMGEYGLQDQTWLRVEVDVRRIPQHTLRHSSTTLETK